jgi:hypothetical protein
MKRFKLNRRTVLRGMLGGSAAMVGLPMLEAMLNDNGTALADGADKPCRFISWFFGNGVRLDRFEPTMTGVGWQASEELAPLAALIDEGYVNLVTGMRNRCSMQITHHEGMTAFSGYDFIHDGGLSSRAGGPTIDQRIADKIGTTTAVSSVHVGISRKTSVMDQGTTLFAVSHRGPNEPQYPVYNPQEVWQRLFGNFVPKPDDKELRLSILSAVTADNERLKQRLGKLDRERLDAHLDGVNELQKKIQTLPPVCQLPAMPTETNPVNSPIEPFDSVSDALDDLITYAFVCDITRVATSLFIGGAAETVFANLGQVNGHHNNTHSSSSSIQNNEVHNAVVYLMTRLAKLCTKLRGTTEPDGTNLLDSTIVYASSDCSEGWSHSIDRQPVILVGHGRGALKYPGIHYQAAPFTSPNTSAGNLSDVLLAVLQAYDPTATSVGGGAPMSSTPLTAIRA